MCLVLFLISVQRAITLSASSPRPSLAVSLIHFDAPTPSQLPSAANLPADSLPLPLKSSQSPLQDDDLGIAGPGVSSLSTDSYESWPSLVLRHSEPRSRFHWPFGFLISVLFSCSQLFFLISSSVPCFRSNLVRLSLSSFSFSVLLTAHSFPLHFEEGFRLKL